MGKRRNLDSGLHSREENQKHEKKRSRSSLMESDVGKEGEKMISSSVKGTNEENKEHVMSSGHNLDPNREDRLATSGTMGGVVPEGTNGSCAPLHENLSLKGEIISKMDDNYREKSFMRKYSKRKKGHGVCEQAPGTNLHDIVNSSMVEINSVSALGNSETDSKSDNFNETHISNNLMISVKQEDFIPKAADDDPEKHEMAGKMDSSSLDNKSSLSVKPARHYQRKRKAQSISESHSFDNSPSLTNVMVLDRLRDNVCEPSISASMKPLDEMTGGQSNCVQSGSKKSCMESGINISLKAKDSRPWARDMLFWQEKTYSSRENPSGSSRENPSGSSVSVSQNSMSASKIADPDAEHQNNSEASAREKQKILSEDKCIHKSTGAGVAAKIDKPLEVDSKTIDAKKTKSRKRNRGRRKGRSKSSNHSSVVSPALPSHDGISTNNSTLPGTTNMDSSGGNNILESITGNLTSSVENYSNTLREGLPVVSDSSRVLPEIISDTNSVKVNTTDVSIKPKQKKETNDHDSLEIDSSDHLAISLSQSETLEMDEMLERDKVDTSLGNNLNIKVLPEDSGSISGPNDNSQGRSSFHLKKGDSSSCLEALHGKESKKREIGKCLDCTIEQIPGDKPSHQLHILGFAQADGSNMATKSKVRTRKKEMKHAVQDSKEFYGACLQKGMEFNDLINNSSDIETKQSMEVIPSDCKDKTSLPPSPIRGVIDDLTSSDLSNKQNGSLDSLNGEEVSFSFHIISNDVKEKSSETCLEKSFGLMNKIVGQNVKPSTHEISGSTSSLYNGGVIACQEERATSSPTSHFMEVVSSSDAIRNQDRSLEKMTLSPQRGVISSNRKKLLVLDLNGLLADIIADPHRTHRAHRKVGGKSLFKRPFCDDFLKYCFERFNIGVWSSRKNYNVDIVVECLMGHKKDKLLFCWDQSKCTMTGSSTIDNAHKPLVLKELKKLWNKEEPKLPWELGEYTPSNTLLIDDSPYKALCNPPHTGIFPHPYNFRDENDNSLGPGGDLRVYLEGLAMTDDVQNYVREHPFGQSAITDKHPDWKFYLQIIEKIMEPSAGMLKDFQSCSLLDSNMSAKFLHSFADESQELQKQIGCMTGILQMFDRHHLLTVRRPNAHNHKRLPSASGHGHPDSSNHRPDIVLEKNSNKGFSENRRVSMESTRTSFSSSSCSSSFSSLDCNKSTQEPLSFDRIILQDTSSPSPPNLKTDPMNISVHSRRQSLDFREVVKDSINRDSSKLSVKTSTKKELKNNAKNLKPRDSPRPVSGLNESQRVLAKLKQSPWNYSEASELPRLSYDRKDASFFSASRDSPRFSYDGREASRMSLDSRDNGRFVSKLRESPRLSLDSRQGSVRNSNLHSKLNSILNDSDSVTMNQRSSSMASNVVAKLMGLEVMLSPVSSAKERVDNSLMQIQGRKQDHPLKSAVKDPPTPRPKNKDTAMTPISNSRLPIETAPWRQQEKVGIPKKPAFGHHEAQAKQQSESVYSEIGRRLKELEFRQSNKDLRALKQILDAMQDKGMLKRSKGDEQKSESPSPEITQTRNDQNLRSAKVRNQSVSHSFPSFPKGVANPRAYESPIIIMKPAKSIIKSGLTGSSAILLEGLPKLQKLKTSEVSVKKKSHFDKRMARDQTSKATSRIEENSSQINSTRLAPRGNTINSVKTTNSLSPRLQQRKLEVEKKLHHPPVPSSDSNKARRQSGSRQPSESVSPRSRLRRKSTQVPQNDDQLSEVSSETTRNLSHQGDDISVQSDNNISLASEIDNMDSTSADVSREMQDFQNSSLQEKSPVNLNEGVSTAVPEQQPSPISVLDASFYQDDSPSSPVKIISNSLKDDKPSAKFNSEVDHKKLESIEALVQKLSQLNSTDAETQTTDHIASLCETQNPDHRYVSEILLASGLLMKDLTSRPAAPMSIQLHPSGHPINPDLFIVLEQTKSGLLSQLKPVPETDLRPKFSPEKLHRKLIFDVVNEVLVQKLELTSHDPLSTLLIRARKLARIVPTGHRLLREVCAEIDELQAESLKDVNGEEDNNLISGEDVFQQEQGWDNSVVEMPGLVLEIERSIFKELIDEVVCGEANAAAGLYAKSNRRRRQLFAK
ncbi:hypothetical protein J5N97_008421 [Dioscorea zingiberensis]|uniref:FCP1 homology domain-containing protein n=1 Tax=Dioscorea zingiberensis TaxID=325984 RepID=A0A9D5CUU1_9LILI|nr:hypothetical protein J5N97_008421 [Dioscorea zingiberensis]